MTENFHTNIRSDCLCISQRDFLDPRHLNFFGTTTSLFPHALCFFPPKAMPFGRAFYIILPRRAPKTGSRFAKTPNGHHRCGPFRLFETCGACARAPPWYFGSPPVGSPVGEIGEFFFGKRTSVFRDSQKCDLCPSSLFPNARDMITSTLEKRDGKKKLV